MVDDFSYLWNCLPLLLLSTKTFQQLLHGPVLSKKRSIGQFLPWNTIYFPSVLQSAIVPVVNLRLSLPCKQLFLYNKKQSESNTDKLGFDWMPSSQTFRLEDMSWCPHFGNCYISWKYDKSKRFKKLIMHLHKSEKSQFGFDIWYSKQMWYNRGQVKFLNVLHRKQMLIDGVVLFY